MSVQNLNTFGASFFSVVLSTILLMASQIPLQMKAILLLEART
jgi:hypothetical protein